jgi:hypothetical protein
LAVAAENKSAIRKYPPYPDVWGHTLPLPNDESYSVWEDPYEAADGTVLYRVRSRPKSGDEKPTYRILDFFAGNLREISRETDRKFRTGGKFKTIKQAHMGDGSIHLPDGGRAELVSEMISNCRATWDIHFVLRDAEGGIVKDKMLLALYDRPVRTGLLRRCPLSDGKDFHFAHWRQLDGLLTPLGDGTFIIDSRIFLIRFRPDLTSPYITAHPNLFLVDRSVVLKIVKSALHGKAGQLIQLVDNAVHQYLIKLKQETKR